MSYFLRILQHYDPSAGRDFLQLEAQFQELERTSPELPKGRRLQPVSGSEPDNTLVWEGEFASLADVQEAIGRFADNAKHKELFEKQSQFITDIRTEIYKVLEF